MIIVVTGGAGFIGSHLVRRLLADGHVVRVLDNFSTGRQENLTSADPVEGFTAFECDINEGGHFIREVVYGADCIVHLAADISVSECELLPKVAARTNAEGTLNMLTLAEDLGVKRFVYASTAAVYGYDGVMREEDQTWPKSIYGITKLTGELYCMHSNVDTVSLRFFNVYGPGQYSGAVIPSFIQRLKDKNPLIVYGDGEQMRDYVYVDDVVSSIVATLNLDVQFNHVYNVGTGVGTSVLLLANELAKVMQAPLQIKYEEPRDKEIRYSVANTFYAETQLHCDEFAPVLLRDGLKKMLAE